MNTFNGMLVDLDDFMSRREYVKKVGFAWVDSDLFSGISGNLQKTGAVI